MQAKQSFIVSEQLLLTDFLWKYRKEIGIGLLVAVALWYRHSVNKSEKNKKQKRNTQVGCSNRLWD